MDDNGIRLERLIEYGSKEAVIQNLEDAGCAPDVIECCLACMEQGQKNELLRKLEEHRKGILNRMHRAKLLSENEFCLEEKQIDCLDYLVYHIKRCAAAKTDAASDLGGSI